MALTEAQKRELEALKDSDLRDTEVKQYIEKQRQLKKELRERDRGIAETAKAQAAKDNSLDYDGEYFFNKTGDEKRPIIAGKMERLSAHLIEKEFSGANDWAIAMQMLLASSLQFNKALYYDPIKWLNFVPYSDELGAGLTQAGDLVWDNTIGWAADKIDTKLVENNKLPSIRFSIELNNGNINPRVTRDNNPIGFNNPEEIMINQCFEKGVLDWAKVQGYEMKLQPDKSMALEDETGTKMTAEKFKELNDDADTSLEKFLTNRLGMSINYSGPSTSLPSP